METEIKPFDRRRQLNKEREFIALDRQGTQQQTLIAYFNSTWHASK